MTRRTKKKPAPSMPAARVRRAERNAIEAGARRTPNGLLPKEAAEALDRLVAADYAPSETKVMARALIEADKHQTAKMAKAAARKAARSSKRGDSTD